MERICLIVDDEPVMRAYLKAILQKEDYQTLEAENAPQAFLRDRVVQMAAKIIIEPIFEADFEESSFGFRPKRSATEALEAIRIAGNQGHDFVVDADIKGYFMPTISW